MSLLEEPKTRAVDPVLGYQFAVEFNYDPFGIIPPVIPISGYFTEISGLSAEWETAEYKTTNVLGLAQSNNVALRPKHNPVTLKRGVTDSEAFWLWHQLLGLGTRALLRTYVSITMFDRNYKPVLMWSLEQAWPSWVTGPTLQSDSSDIMIEELTLTHSGVNRLPVSPAGQFFSALAQSFIP